MLKSWPIYVVFFLILALTVASYWLGWGGLQAELLRNVAYLAAPAFAVFGGAYTLSVHGWRGTASRPFVFLALGLLLWGLGEVLWVYYEFILRETPYPSLADSFYLLAYPSLFWGLFSQVRMSGVNWKKFDPVIVFLFCIIAILLAGLATYFGIYLAYDDSSTVLENAVAIGYGLADVVIILCSLLVLILAWEFKGGNLMRLYLYCFFAFAMTMVADVGFAMYNGEYVSGQWWIKNTLDTLWIMQYLYFGLAFCLFGLSLKTAQARLLQGMRK
jgi:diguanylate cyclase